MHGFFLFTLLIMAALLLSIDVVYTAILADRAQHLIDDLIK